MMVENDHTGDRRICQSLTGFLIFCNMALIDWVSKKQPPNETSVFGSEFVAMKHGTEKLRGLSYKYRMMGIPLSGPSNVYGDNKSAITNSTTPKSTLKKKSNSICYHAIHESAAMSESLLMHVGTHENLLDIITKPTFGAKRKRLISIWQFWQQRNLARPAYCCTPVSTC